MKELTKANNDIENVDEQKELELLTDNLLLDTKSLPQCQVMNSKKPHYSTKKDGSAVQASSILMSYSHLHLRWHKEW